MVGSSLYKKLKELGYKKITAPGVNHKKVDYRDIHATYKLFRRKKFDYVFHLAAKVGGIQANINQPVQFLNDNLLINSHIFYCAYNTKVKKLLYLGSSCIYPAKCPQPMKEEYLLSGPLESTNEGYALAKIVGLKLAKYYHKQYNLQTVCLMPCNIYGTNDHYDLENSHVLSALIKKFVDAKNNKENLVTLWGTGKAKREFIHVYDVVEAIMYFFRIIDTPDIINIGTNKDLTIKQLATIISKEVGYKGRIVWDRTKPDGMMRKCLDVSKMNRMGFKPKVDLVTGIRQSIKEYKGEQ